MRTLVTLGIAGLAFWLTWRRAAEEQMIPIVISPFKARMYRLDHERKDRQRRRGKTC